MGAIGYYNGKIGALESMTVPMLDRANYFGDGCYEACLVQNGKAFALREHLERFERSLSLLEIEPPCNRDELRAVLDRCVEASNEPSAVLYWQCSRGTAGRKHGFPAPSVRPNLCVMVTPKSIPPFDGTMRLMTTEDNRFSMCHVKTLNLLPNVLANQHAASRGLDGAIFVRNGVVTEGTHSNVSILKGGVLYTHPLDEHILAGVTRKRLLALCDRLGIRVCEEPFLKNALYDADEVLITSSTMHIRSAVEIDGTAVGGGAKELLCRLQSAYRTEFSKETK